MEFITCADLHIHSKVPENRKGDFFTQVMDKFNFILKEAEKTDSKVLVVAGDFFDSPNVSYKITRAVLESIKNSNVTILAVAGQHDLRYHVGELNNTPLGILQTSGQVTILNPRNKFIINDISFIGCGWNETPEIEADVLVLHLMVTKKGELWPGQTNYSTAHALLRKYPWAKIIVSGDNHIPHTLKTKSGKFQINCGSMIRTTKTQINFQPRIQKIDTDNLTIKNIKIPIIDSELCFDFSKIAIEELKGEAKEHAEAKIAEFINMLPKNQKEKPEFKSILNNIVSNINPRQGVKTIIANTMEKLI